MLDETELRRLPGTSRGGRAVRQRQEVQDWQGTSVIGELLGQIRAAGRPLTPVFRTDDKLFTGVTVPFVWVRGKSSFTSRDSEGRSNLWLDIPNDVYRHVQSRYAEWVLQRWFGRTEPVDLQAPQRTDYLDRPLDMDLHQRLGSGEWEREIVTDWDRLVAAMEMTDRLGSQALGPAKLTLFLSPEIPARIEGDHLELNIQPVVPMIRRAWVRTLKEQLLED